jgi:2-polyprenyl-6-methoxyphenol hydroxylase-like FAD-dependent oxidoreductase
MQQVETLIIVGGGTSGWIAAALLKARFGPSLSVTVIESDRIGTIGVGEASLPVLRNFLRSLKIDERELLRECEASLKAGLKFRGWRTQEPGDAYYHLFFGTEQDEPLLQWIERLHARSDTTGPWHDLLAQGLIDGRDFMTSHTLAGHLIAQRKASKRPADRFYESPLGYAYHLDAKLFAEFLRRWSVQRGVRHLQDHVVRVDVQEDGNIRAVVTEKEGAIEGDFFIDCTGFRGVLINEALQEPFESYHPWLLCDSAVAIQLPHERKDGELAAYTCLDALSAGWSWRIPLFSRQGSGYVYSRSFITSEEAESELRSRLGPGADASKAHHLRMRVGKNRRTWVNNCLSVGLAAGFLEALESTSIAFIQRGVAKFLACFQDRRFDAGDQEIYNREVTEDFEECRDFIFLHYCLTERDDSPFWQTCRSMELPERLVAVLEEWRGRGSLRDFVSQHGDGRFFPPVSWYSILLGMTGPPKTNGAGGAAIERSSAVEWLSQGRSRLTGLASEFLDHRAYLAGLREEADRAPQA